MLNQTYIKNKINDNSSKLQTLKFILQEISTRMIDRLNYIKIKPKNILDLGSGLGIDSMQLANQFSNARLIKIDIAVNLLKLQATHRNFISNLFSGTSNIKQICADATILPIAGQTIDLVYTNMLLPYLSDPQALFKEIRRVLTLGGGFCISGLGVDSFKQLRQLGLSTYNFPDMHDIGDMLLALGFTNPVVDSEYITLEYDSIDQMFADAKLIGCGGAATTCKYLGKNYQQAIKDNLDLIKKNNKYQLTLEMFFAYGWKDKPVIDLPHGQSIVQFVKK